MIQTHVEHAYTRRETGGYGGGDHIVVDEAITIGRLHRQRGDALCKPRRKFWGLHYSGHDEPNCKRCLEIAERLS